MENKYLQEFEEFMKDRLTASTAFVEGDFEPLKQISVERSPATIFGPKGDCVQGVEKVNAVNAQGAAMFESPAENEFEVMHQNADEHLAYWTGVQHAVLRMKGQEEPVKMDLRVTEIFKKENGKWKLMHRHADKLVDSKTE